MMVDEWGMTYCKNCGHESHCGHPLTKSYRRQPYEHGPEGEIEVCKYCRCQKCKNPDCGEREKQMVGVDCNNLECANPRCTCDPCDCTEENPCKCCVKQDET